MTVQKSNLMLTSCCGFCSKTENLLRCSRCKVMFYCNGEHQAAHREAHKSACNMVAKRRTRLNAEEDALRSRPADPWSWLPSDIFRDCEGMFWGYLETREYMRARFALVEALKRIDTHISVQTQIDHLMDMLRLCRSDNMGVRDIIPSLLLRLNKDQECYDFVKWWQTTGQDSHYDWGNTKLPYLDIRNADPFEPIDIFCSRWLDLSQTVAVMLLKIKLLLDLKALQNSAVIGEKVPSEILDSIQRHIVQSPIISSNRKLMERCDHSDDIEVLECQIDDLFMAVQMANPFFWRRLVNPGRHLTARPAAYSKGSVEEMQLVLQYSYDAWIETPGAIDMIEEIIGDFDEGIEDSDLDDDELVCW